MRPIERDAAVESAPACAHSEATGLRVGQPLWRAVKRAEDLVVGVPLLVLTLPLQALVAAAVKLDSSGPVLFRQERVGRDGRLIQVAKFRTMCVDAEDRLRADREMLETYRQSGYKLPEGRDPRVTRVGRWLRKSSLDELPQLWGVVAGTMSMVGPRPVVEEEAITLHGDTVHLYLAVKPGLTGPWQVAGRSRASSAQRKRLVAEYVRHWSVARDLAILVRTVPAVLTARGAH